MSLDPSQALSEMERAVSKALARGFEDALVVAALERECMVRIANSRVAVSQSWERGLAHLYLARKRRIFLVEVDVLRRGALEKAVERVDEVHGLVEESELYAPLPEPTGRPLEGLADPKVRGSLDRAPELASAVLEGAEASVKGCRVAGTLRLSHGYRVLVSGRGARLVEERTSVEVYARVFVGESSGQWSWTSTRLEEAALREVGRRAAEYAALASKTVSVEPGEYDAVLSPMVLGNLLGDLMFMASALSVMIGASVFTKHGVGSRIGTELVTVVDDPLDPSLPESTGFDDEGVATERKAVVEKGVVKNLLHNSKTASKMGAKTTGNAGLVEPRPWNVVLEPGDAREDELVAELKRGFVVTNNWYTRYQNYVEGEFSTVTRDALLYVENGEVVGGVRRLRIDSTVPRLLSSVKMLSREAYQVKWWEVPFPTRAPFAYVEKLRFTRPEL